MAKFGTMAGVMGGMKLPKPKIAPAPARLEKPKRTGLQANNNMAKAFGAAARSAKSKGKR